ncbi:MAG: DUF4998 domain-containing protein [Cytophagales bacterium]|nr:DUF4998 domain-containing protein [Cytophagales bacterium]
MIKYAKRGVTYLLVLIILISCDNASSFLDQHLENGPIIYAAKVDQLTTQSGHYRFRINIYPAEDVNRSYCRLKWNITNDIKDSVQVNFSEDNYDPDLSSYYAIIDVSKDSIFGNLLIEAQNFDYFGNASLITEEIAFIYGDNFISSLTNDKIGFSPDSDKIEISRQLGSVGNYISYELADGSFTEEVFTKESEIPLENAKSGGIVRNKSRILVRETDIDTLGTTFYSETKIPYAPPQIVDFCKEENADFSATYAFDGLVNHTDGSHMWHTGWSHNDHQKFHNNNSDTTLAHYYVIDYKDEFMMKSISIYNDNVGFLKTVDIWISNDPRYTPGKGTDQSVADYWRVPHENNWVKIGSMSFEQKANVIKTLELGSPKEFRLLILTMPDSHNTGNGNIRISEIKVDAIRKDD